jgi:hypothetical protein
MNLIFIILRMVRRVAIWLLTAYWLIFLGYTIKNFVEGGSTAVVGWYKHISGNPFQWHWGVFLLQQIVMLALTLALYFFERRRGSAASQ